MFFLVFILLKKKYLYLKPTDACQTKASNRKNTGIAGSTSTTGQKPHKLPVT